MATGGVPGSRKDEDFRYTCTLCMEPYRGRSPKILPCFHSFCLPCLTALEASVTTAISESSSRSEDEKKSDDQKNDEGKTTEVEEETESENTKPDVARENKADAENQIGPGKIFLCPTCRAPVTVPEGGVACLQTNFYVDHETNEEGAPPPVLCGMCDEGSQEPATHTCQECQSHMCRTCRRYHDKFMASHHVTSVSASQPVKPRKKAEEEKALCMVHRDQVLCFHCRQCQVNICLHCKFSSHEGHDTLELARAVLEAKEEMTSLLTSAQQQIQIMQSSLRSLDRKERQLTRHAQEMTQKVNARFDQLMTWGQKSRDRLLDAVTCKEDTDKNELETEKSTMTAAISTLKSLVVRATTQSPGCDPDVMALRNELKGGLLAEDRMKHHQEQAESQDDTWSWNYDDSSAASLLTADDVQAYMGSLVDGSATNLVTPSVSFHELIAKVDRLSRNEADIHKELASVREDLEKKMTSACNDLEQKMTTFAQDTKKGETILQQSTTNLQQDMSDLRKAKMELQKTQKSLADDIKSLNKNEAQQNKNITSLADDIKSLNKNEAEQKKNMTTLKQEVELVKKSEADSQKVVKAVKEKLGKTVVFHASGCNTTKTTNGSTLIFKGVNVNTGNGYDKTTGLFTAPLSGTYVFASTVGNKHGSSNVWAAIHVNGYQRAEMRGNYFSTGSSSLYVVLKARDTVQVQTHSNPEAYFDNETVFTGTLLQAEM